MSPVIKTRLLIIGSGPAGCSAAIYASRAMLEPIVLTGEQPGGQLVITGQVENYPGFPTIEGPKLMEQMHDHAKHYGAKFINDQAAKVDFSKNQSGFTKIIVTTNSVNIYEADSLIIATGARARWLGMPSEIKFRGKGVSACATCDGFFFQEKTVLVVGGGNTAVEEALFLTKYANKVILVHRRDQLRAEKILQKRLTQHPKIELILNSILEEILGNDDALCVTGVRLRNTKTGLSKHVTVDGVFIAIGYEPAVDLFRELLELKKTGYIWTAPDSTKTSVQGVFAAGDITDESFKQAITAAGMGCMAALEAEKYLENCGLLA